MKVNFEHVFTDHHGKEVKMQRDGAPATMKDIAVDGLMYPSDTEMGKMNGQQKVKRHDLAVKIMNFGNQAEIIAEDVVMLKEIIGARYIPAVVAQAFALLDGSELPKYS